jgi:hypothetical protein
MGRTLMPQWQPVQIPITGGIDNDSDPLLSPRPQALTNVRYDRIGSLTKRYGTACITGSSSTFNQRLGGARPPNAAGNCPVPETLCTYKGRLLRIGNGELDALGDASSSTPWSFRDFVPECNIETRVIGAATLGSSSFFGAHASSAIIGNVRCTVWSNANLELQYSVERLDTGAVISTGIVSGSGGSSNLVTSCKVVADSTAGLFGIFFGVIDNGLVTIAIRMTSLNASTLAFGTTTTLAIGAATNGVFDVDLNVTNTWVIVYELAAGANRIQVRTVDATATLGTATTLVTGDNTIVNFSIRVTSARVWLVYNKTDGGATITSRGWSLTVPLVAAVGPVSLGSSTYVTAGPNRIAIQELSAGGAYFAATYGGTTSFAQLSTSLSATGTIAYNYLTIVSRPFEDLTAGRVYCWAHNVHSVQGSYFLLDMGNGLSATAFTKQHRMVAIAGPGKLVTPTADRYSVNWRIVQDVVAEGTDRRWTLPVLFNVSNAASWIIKDSQIALVTAHFANLKRTFVETPDHLLFSGGLTTAYDGSQVFELGFAYPPDMAVPAAFTQAATGSLTTLSTYGITFTYAWTDAQGNRHRSAPSAVRSTLLTGANNRIQGTAPNLILTNRYNAADETLSDVVIEVWRTAANGSVYYLDSVVASRRDTATVTFDATQADTTLTTREQLPYSPYVEGGELDNIIPSGARAIAYHQNAIVIGGEDGTVWFSKPYSKGDGWGFNEAITLDPFEGGAPVAFASLGELLAIFKENDIYVLAGQLPAANGTSNLALPQYVESDSGCQDPRSIAYWNEGVGFMSKSAYAVLTRSLQISHIGHRIEPLLGAGPVLATATIPATNTIKVTTASATYVYDTRVGNVQDPCWTRDVYTTGAGTSTASVTVAACAYDDSWARAQDDGRIFLEATADYWDRLGASKDWVPIGVTLPIVPMGTVAGFGRIRAFAIVGTASACNVTVAVSKDGGSYLATTNATLAVSAFTSKRIHLAAQKGQFFSVVIADASTGAADDGAGLTLRCVAAEVAVDGNLSRQLRAADRNA